MDHENHDLYYLQNFNDRIKDKNLTNDDFINLSPNPNSRESNNQHPFGFSDSTNYTMNSNRNYQQDQQKIFGRRDGNHFGDNQSKLGQNLLRGKIVINQQK